MDRLNRKQRVTVWVAIGLALLMFAFPYGFVYGEGVGYKPIWRNNEIEYGRLLIQYALLLVVTWATITTLRSPK